MKKIELGLNILHYCIYRAHYNLHLLANKINPLNLIHELPFQKRRYEKLGIDIHKEIDKAFSDKSNGLSIMVAGGALFGLIFFLLFAITKILMNAIDNVTVLSARYFITFGVLSLIICYLFVFKEDKYLVYFKDFESWTKGESQKYSRISFIVVVFLMFLLSLSWNR
jgi:hypothetical protein